MRNLTCLMPILILGLLPALASAGEPSLLNDATTDLIRRSSTAADVKKALDKPGITEGRETHTIHTSAVKKDCGCSTSGHCDCDNCDCLDCPADCACHKKTVSKKQTAAPPLHLPQGAKPASWNGEKWTAKADDNLGDWTWEEPAPANDNRGSWTRIISVIQPVSVPIYQPPVFYQPVQMTPMSQLPVATSGACRT